MKLPLLHGYTNKKKNYNKMKSKTTTKRDVHLPRASNRKGLL